MAAKNYSPAYNAVSRIMNGNTGGYINSDWSKFREWCVDNGTTMKDVVEYFIKEGKYKDIIKDVKKYYRGKR